MKENKSETKTRLRLIHWLPFLLLIVINLLFIVNSLLSDGARDTMTEIANICMYVFAGLSFLAAIVSCVFDMKNFIAEKKGKSIFFFLLNILGILLWIFLLYLNSSFSS